MLNVRAKRAVVGLIAIVGAIVGLSSITAGPATAAGTGSWRAFGNTNPITSSTSHWTCGATVGIDGNLIAQVCVVRSAFGDTVQGAVIVRNNGPFVFALEASGTVLNADEIAIRTWDCPMSGVGANSWSVCFGQTFTDEFAVFARGFANRPLPQTALS